MQRSADHIIMIIYINKNSEIIFGNGNRNKEYG